MSEMINNVTQRKEMIKNILRGLHAGKPLEELKAQFAELAKEADASEIAEVEQMLIGEGMPTADIQELCDLHVAVVREALDHQPPPETIPGHPVFTFRAENQVGARFLNGLQDALAVPGSAGLAAARQQLQKLMEFDRHYLRKENLLFPYLEKHSFTGPSAVMWGIHDEIRAGWKQLDALLESGPEGDETAFIASVNKVFEKLDHQMREMFYKEEKILFPAAMDRLSEKEWADIRAQESELGYFMIQPSADWKPAAKEAEEAAPPRAGETGNAAATAGEIPLSTGVLTPEQINLMLTHLPVDVTFVDEQDRVRFFSQTKERIFERQPAIIGRKVQNCHPPQSVHKVQKILEDFRSGKRDVAEFWIQMMGKFIHIRYFALRDDAGNYRGTIEVSQDVALIRALEGEKRLLDDAG